MAKDLVRRIEKIEQQQTPTPSDDVGLVDRIYGGTAFPLPSRREFAALLRRAMAQMDGGAQLVPGEPQIVAKGIYQ